MRMMPRTVPGTLTSHNKGSMKWGSHGLLAYGSNTMVAVVDSCTMQHVTTLHSHRSPVTKISWAPSPLPADDSERPVYLASADTTGYIVIFDVTAGKAKQRLSEGNKVVNAIEMFYSSGTDLLLLSLHQTALLILWSPLTSDQMWRKNFTEALSTFTRDPFNSSCLVLNGGSFIQYVTDFSAAHAPSDGTRFFLSSSQSEPMSPSASSADKNKRTSVLFDIPRRSRLMLQSDKSSKSSTSLDEESQLSNLLNVFYHKTRRNTLVLVYSQDILILDLDIKQTISIVSLERSTCPFVDVYPCRYRDAMYCLHDNGTVVFRVRKLTAPPDSGSNGSSLMPEFLYESTCSSDGMRITKSQKVFGLAVCPTSEIKTAVITSEGKLLVWELRDDMRDDTGTKRPVISLSDLILPSTCGGNMILEDTQKYSFILTGITNSLAHAPFVLKMCPPLTTKNFHLYQPYLAIGSINGVVHIYDIKSGSLVRDLTVHSSQIRGIEWTSLHSLITHACESLTGSQGKSELAFINIKTGKVTNFRPSKPDEGVIQMVRVSYLKQYMVIVFKNKPMELWELKTLTLLREMPTNFPVITSLEWSPSAFKKRLPGSDGHEVSSSHHMVKEHFVFTDNTCLLHHYIVEGSIIKDGSTITAQGVSGTVTAMAWKNELLILGDVNSNLSFWDLKAKKSVNMVMSKGMVRKIRMAPGKDNNKILILFNEELQIWDKNAKEVISSLKFPKTIGRVNDADWAASDKITLSVSDGYVAITDVYLQSFMSRLEDSTDESRSLPCLLSRSASLAQLYSLYHQPWATGELSLPEKIDIPIETMDYLRSESCPTTDRCLIAAHTFGDQFAIDFWTVASYYLNKMKLEKWKHVKTPTSDSKDELDLFVPSTTSDIEETIELSENSTTDLLESNYDMLCSNKTFKSTELSRVSLQCNKKYGARLECARRYILLGEADKAVHLLLESESDSPSFYSDSLRACLLATVRTSGASQSTLKLVATSLIANGKLSEGVELLCLIDKGLDACRYLQTYGHWDEAVWLSKVTLNHEDTAEVITRWINEHLSSPSVNEKGQAVLASLSIGDIMKAVELLYGMQCFSLCAMFIEACTQLELLEINDQTQPIIEAVYLQYARLLKSVDMCDGALYYCKKAGEQGSQLLTELEAKSD